MKLFLIFILLFIFSATGFSQYPPAAGISGSTAIYKDSSVFVNWAKSCVVQRGLYDISQPEDSVVTNGINTDALGKANATSVSLGDSGVAVMSFYPPIVNGTGFDFAVFENSFDGNFLELAFVEVSSDSIHWYRFDAMSLTQNSTQVSTFGTLDPTKINNLAGKYKAFFGTPFDLDELTGKPFLNLDSIYYVKIIDVVGSIQTSFASYDSQGNIINDPWPTPFFTGGFDLDAVGVIHQGTQSVSVEQSEVINLWPNPCEDFIQVKFNGCGKYDVVNISGEVILSGSFCDHLNLNTSLLNAGFYSIRITNGKGISYSKFIEK